MHEELTLLCILETADKVDGLEPCQPHFAKFRDWLHMQIDRAKKGQYTLVEAEGPRYVGPAARPACGPPRGALPAGAHGRESLDGHRPLSASAKMPTPSSRGGADALDILMEGRRADGHLQRGQCGATAPSCAYCRTCGRTSASSRSAAYGRHDGELILRDLVAEGGHFPFYSNYTFTDVSAGFFPQARERFAYASNLEFRVFDISKDPFEQGFKPASYDLIMAGNVIPRHTVAAQYPCPTSSRCSSTTACSS